jgi:hypothetical protein
MPRAIQAVLFCAMGDTRYLTVASLEEPDGTELLLEPIGEHSGTNVFKQALYNEGRQV